MLVSVERWGEKLRETHFQIWQAKYATPTA